MATVFDRVRKVVAKQLHVNEKGVTLSTSFAKDLNADSLDLVELLTALEEAFSKDGKPLVIDDEDAEGLVTVQDAVDYIKGKGIEDE